jgi:cell division protein FtsI/penicillin-binding protein 2
MVLALALLGTRAAFLGTVRANDLSARADDQRSRTLQLPARRGSILTRDGQELASTRPALLVTADPSKIDDPVAVAKALAPILDRPAKDIFDQLSRPKRYEVLHRAVPADRKEALAALSIAGVTVEDTDQRFYPRGRLAGQLVGFTGEDQETGKKDVGIAGFELQFDKELTGRPGRRVELQDPFAEPLRVLDDQPPVPGTDVHISLDASIQDYTEQVLARVRRDSGATAVSAIVMRPSDGAIYAMASVPRFDPNDRSNLPEDRITSRPVVDVLEPGSTFKVIPIAGAIEEGIVTPQTAFHLPISWTLTFDGKETTLHEAHVREEITANVAQILKQSSNIGTYRIADRLSQKNRLEYWIKRFGVTEKTGIDFPGEAEGIYTPASEWSGVSILNIPIGQGISVTLTQMARAYAALANGGRLVTPHFVTKIGTTAVKAPEGQRIFSEATANTMTQMLKGVVSEGGTGVEAEIPGYDVAGKTGTSNKIAPDGTYDKNRYWASFIGYLPANDPRLLVAVVVDEPGGENVYGGDVAAPAFEKIAKFAINRLSISP